MATHTAHIGMPEGAVLADDCDRCYEHAMHPFATLDDSHLSRLNQMAIAGTSPLTAMDFKAISEIIAVKAANERLQRLPV